MRYIRWEARSLYDIYNKWKLTSNKSFKAISVTNFENEFKKYFSEMFPKIKKRYRKMLKKYPTIKSISTDSYSASIVFQNKENENSEQVTETKINNDNNIDEGDNEEEIMEKIKSVIKEVKKPKIENKIDFESEYPKFLSSNKKIFKEIMFEATNLQSTDQFLEKFYIAGGG